MAHHVKAHHNGTDADVVTVHVQVGDGEATANGSQVAHSPIQETEPQNVVHNLAYAGISSAGLAHAPSVSTKRSFCDLERNLAITNRSYETDKIERPRKRSRAARRVTGGLPVPSEQISDFISSRKSFFAAVDSIASGHGNEVVTAVSNRGVKLEVGNFENEQPQGLGSATNLAQATVNDGSVYLNLGATAPQPDQAGAPAVEAILEQSLGAQIFNTPPTVLSERAVYTAPNSGEVRSMYAMVSQHGVSQTPNLVPMQCVVNGAHLSRVAHAEGIAGYHHDLEAGAKSNNGSNLQVDNSIGIFAGVGNGLQNTQGSQVISAEGDNTVFEEMGVATEEAANLHEGNVVQGVGCTEGRDNVANHVAGISEEGTSDTTKSELVCNVDSSNDSTEPVTEFEEIDRILSALDPYSEDFLEVDAETIQSANLQIQRFDDLDGFWSSIGF